METKRCSYCQKVQRASTPVCGRCGRSFVQKSSTDPARVVTTPSAPIASLHRAGHYAGLHPEDQPYQSTQMLVQRSVRADRDLTPPASLEEPNRIIFPPTAAIPALTKQRDVPSLQRRLPPSRLIQSLQHPAYRLRKTIWSHRVTSFLLVVSCLFFLVASSIISFVLIGHQSTQAAALVQVMPGTIMMDTPFMVTGRGFGPGDLISLVNDNTQPIVAVSGQPLVVRTDKRGTFSVRLYAPRTWRPGKHTMHVIDKKIALNRALSIILQPTPAPVASLQIEPVNCCDLGTGTLAAVSRKDLALTNPGSGEVSWQGSSDQAWLTLSSTHGIFAQSEVVQVTGRRAGLSQGKYTGHVTISQQAQNVVLTVTMSVAATPVVPGQLTLSPMALTYQTSSGQDPADQLIVLQNTGGQNISWSARTNTATAPTSTWLALTPDSGSLYPGATINVHVAVHAQQLAVGTYQNRIAFTVATVTFVPVHLIVTQSSPIMPTVTPSPLPTATVAVTPTPTVTAGSSTPPVSSISITPTQLNFTTGAGSDPVAQTITITNTGGTPLNWSIRLPADASWLSPDVSSGSLLTNASATISVSCHSSTLLIGSHQTSISVYNSDTGQLVGTQSVPVTCLIT